MSKTPSWPETFSVLTTLFRGGDEWTEHCVVLRRLRSDTDSSHSAVLGLGHWFHNLPGQRVVFWAPATWFWPGELTCSYLGWTHPSQRCFLVTQQHKLPCSHHRACACPPRLRCRFLLCVSYSQKAMLWILLTDSGCLTPDCGHCSKEVFFMQTKLVWEFLNFYN